MLDINGCDNSTCKVQVLQLEEKLKAETALYEEKLKHMQTVIDIQDNMILVNDGTHLLESNQSFLNFFKKQDLKQFKENSQCICNKFIHVNDPKYISYDTAKNEWAKYILDNPLPEYRVVLKNSVGENITFRVQVKELLTKEKNRHYVSTFINITKELEELDLLQSVSSLENIHYLVFNKNSRKYTISKSLSLMLGLPLQGAIHKIKFKNYMQTKYLNLIAKSIKKDTDNFEIEVNHNNKNMFFIVQKYISYLDHAMQHVYLLVDISKLKQVEKESKQKDIVMFQQAKMAQMGEMVSMIAHQWRQPINAISASSIKLSLSNMLEQLEPTEIEKHAQFVQAQCQKMSQIIDSFMNYSNSQKEDESFAVCDAIDTVYKFVKAQYKAHNIKIIVEKRCNMDDILFGRKDLLEQVLLNLLSNSKDAFENINTNKEKYIIIKCLSNKEIFVEDNAGGITAQTIEKLFMPYFTTKEQGKGTGLGLYMSRKIIREHFNGNLTYTKDKNRSIFTLTIGERNG